MPNTLEDALAKRIIDVAVQRSGHGGEAFNYDLAQDPGNWEAGIWNAVRGWVSNAVLFTKALEFDPAKDMSLPDDVFTTSNTNKGTRPILWKPGEEVSVSQTVSWHVTAGIAASVTVSEEASVTIGVASAGESASFTLTGTLETGHAESATVNRSYKWDDEVTVGPGEKWKAIMTVTRKQVNTNFKVTVHADVKPGLDTLIYQDDFQGYHNVFDFAFLSNDNRQWVAEGTLDADAALDNNTVFEQAPAA